jgi:hypothetical protein
MEGQQEQQIDRNKIEELQARDITEGEVEQPGETGRSQRHCRNQAPDRLDQATHKQGSLRGQQQKDNDPDQPNGEIEYPGKRHMLCTQIITEIDGMAHL